MRNHIKDAFIIGIITLGLLGVLELSLRYIYQRTQVYQSHPVYLRQLGEDMEETFIRSKENGGDTVVMKTNSDRFRGEAISENPAKRVIIYGDSNIQARFSEKENTLSGKVGTRLKEQLGLDVEVINAGVVGFGPDQILLRMTEELPKYQPDLIVFHVFADNDLGDLLRNRLLKLDGDGEIIAYGKTRNSFLASLLLYRAAGVFAAKLNQQEVPTYDDLHSQLFDWARQEYEVYIDPSKATPVYGDHYDIDVATDPSAASSKLKVNLLRGILKEAHEFARQQGARLVVLIQPSVIDISHNYNLDYEYMQAEFPAYDQQNLTKAMEDICLDNAIPHLNLYDLFIENDPDDLYFYNDTHWNDRGQALAATELSNYILRNNLIAP